MKFILGTLAAVAVASLAFAQPAEARCCWNGFGMVCVHHPHHFGFDRPYYGDFGPRPYWWGGY